MSSRNTRNNNNNAASASSSRPSEGASLTTMEPELSTCPKCNREVPAANLILHEARCNNDDDGARSATTQQTESMQQVVPEPLERQLSPREQRQQSTLHREPPTTATTSSSTRSTSYRRAATNSSVGTASYVGNIRPPPTTTQPAATTQAQTSADTTTTTTTTAGDQNNTIQLRGGQWQCPRCTLINENIDIRCNACLAPRNNGGRNSNSNERLVQQEVENNEWVNVTYNPHFRRQNGVQQIPNPTVRTNPDRVGTATRVFNGLVNGAIVGSVFAGTLGMLVGAVAGAAGGAIADRARNRAEQNDAREVQSVADMLANDNGGIEAGTVRVHRGGGHITAVTNNGRGQNRVIRLRYGGGAFPAQNNNDEMERALLDVLMRMSYSRDFGRGNNNVILQPEETFEELISRFGLGNENRGASQQVIDSYPVEVVRRSKKRKKTVVEEDGENRDGLEGGKKQRPALSDCNEEDASSSDVSTCGICLEDYKDGEETKKLSCPNHPHCFHKDCIDKWLKVVASCPICKHEVGMYEPTAASC